MTTTTDPERIARLHESVKRQFNGCVETLMVLAPDDMHDHIKLLGVRLGDVASTTNDHFSDVSDVTNLLFSIVDSLATIAPHVKIERARLHHVNVTSVRVYNSSIAQHRDAGAEIIDRTTLSPFNH